MKKRLCAWMVLSLGLIVLTALWARPRKIDPSGLHLDDVAVRAEAKGWRVQRGYDGGRAIFVLSKNARASGSTAQTGALYVVEAASAEKAQQELLGGDRSERCLGHFYLSGDLSMVPVLFRR